MAMSDLYTFLWYLKLYASNYTMMTYGYFNLWRQHKYDCLSHIWNGDSVDVQALPNIYNLTQNLDEWSKRLKTAIFNVSQTNGPSEQKHKSTTVKLRLEFFT